MENKLFHLGSFLVVSIAILSSFFAGRYISQDQVTQPETQVLAKAKIEKANKGCTTI